MSEMNYNNIFAEVTKAPRPHQLAPFPRVNPSTGKEFEIAIVVITAEESALLTAEAERKTRKMLKGDVPAESEARRGYDELFNVMLAEGLLFEAIRQPDDVNKRFFPNKASILQVLSMDEIAVLLNEYYQVQSYMGPVISELTPEAMEEMITLLKKKDADHSLILNFFSSDCMKELIAHMVKQLPSLPTSKSSSGLHQDDTITSIPTP